MCAADRGERLDDIDDDDELKTLQRRILLASERVERRLNFVENEQKTMCKICANAKIDAACFPCGHTFACAACAGKAGRRCAVCRAEITKVLKLYD